MCVPDHLDFGDAPGRLSQRPPGIIELGAGLIRRISSTSWSDMVFTSLGIEVLRLGILLPVTYSLSSLTCGFRSLLSTLAHAVSEQRMVTLRMVCFTVNGLNVVEC